jgi:hypothetical protein
MGFGSLYGLAIVQRINQLSVTLGEGDVFFGRNLHAQPSPSDLAHAFLPDLRKRANTALVPTGTTITRVWSGPTRLTRFADRRIIGMNFIVTMMQFQRNTRAD